MIDLSDMQTMQTGPMSNYFRTILRASLLLNKDDLSARRSETDLQQLSRIAPTVRISATTGAGLDELVSRTYDVITAEASPVVEGAIITNERHFAAIEGARESLILAKSALDQGFTEEVALSQLHRALSTLGVITGETLITDILNQVFSTFCIGK